LRLALGGFAIKILGANVITQSLNGEWQFRKLGETEWLPAQVPGGVHTDLLRLGRIPDPFAADNELKVQWVAESDWEYTRRFTLEQPLRNLSRLFLVCDGLDTLTEVFLNGQSLGSAEKFRHRQIMALHWRERADRPLRFAGQIRARALPTA
jgi:hypothetical protein